MVCYTTAMSNNTRYLTVHEVAGVMRTHPETIRRWLRRGFFPNALKTPSGHDWRIPEADLDALGQTAPDQDERPAI